jgi:homoserine acetyltransferase
MSDPNWKNGFYYDSTPPHIGIFLEIATITYRSGPEWDVRFGRNYRGAEPGKPHTPALCPDFLIETYLDHQVPPSLSIFFVWLTHVT